MRSIIFEVRRSVRRLLHTLDSNDESLYEIRGHGVNREHLKPLRHKIDGSCEPLRSGDLIKYSPPSRWKTGQYRKSKGAETRDGADKTNLEESACQLGPLPHCGEESLHSFEHRGALSSLQLRTSGF
jgi:hypothetical protein